MKFVLSTFVYVLASLTAVAGSAELPIVTVTHRSVEGIGATPGVMRRDPSDIIRVDDTYYVWYSRGKISPGYDATVWYATSSDGVHWDEQGQALAKGEPGGWDGASVFTPNILVAEGRYWLFYTGTSRKFQKGFNPDSKIGVAVSESPNGPWSRVGDGPVVTNSEHGNDFDSHLVDDACLVARDGKYWLYYKGRQLGKGPGQTQMGVAVAEDPQGPYMKHAANPVIPGNHEVLVWPQGGGVAAMIGTTGPKEITNSIMYAADGIRFTKTYHVNSGPWAGGVYRADDFKMDYSGGSPKWGIEIGRPVKGGGTRLPFLQRFEIPEVSQQSMR
ncbi:family 43 glycosylhydrolase [Crateriforma spongiae]|uniref:family 43 glycosylhydrolase n=1 Tax=Crateriforma spongiae TaxID=2724528 RepID=UPI001447C3B3|nr:family 43 glycosylhydrolase [Crateriforma spongiae]